VLFMVFGFTGNTLVINLILARVVNIIAVPTL
jgi:hypothetical protein